MKKLCIVLLGLLFMLSAAGLGEELVSDAEWQIPDLSQVDADTPAQLLILKVAQEEVGYIEGKNNYTKYGEWFGTPNCQWCAEFLSWCVGQVDERYGLELLDTQYPYCDSARKGAIWFYERGRYVGSNGVYYPNNVKQWWPQTGEYAQVNEYIPSPGDYMWLYIHSQGYYAVHATIVEGVSRAEDGDISIHVIEGNWPDRVQRAVYSIADKRIYGFGTPEKIIETELRLYCQCDDVIYLKQTLKNLGYYTAKDLSNKYTDKLAQAVKSFQKDHGLKKSSNVSREIWQAIEQAAAEMQQDSE